MKFVKQSSSSGRKIREAPKERHDIQALNFYSRKEQKLKQKAGKQREKRVTANWSRKFDYGLHPNLVANFHTFLEN